MSDAPNSEPLSDLSAARILVTNDDGIHAPGLKALENIARALSDDVWVVAPLTEQSATSHSLTMRRPLRVATLSERHYSVDGTPTDCVLVALRTIIKGRTPDLVLSGVNMGANLGEDVTYSGTVAAAMEAALLGVRAIALSQMRSGEGHDFRWHTAEHYGPGIVQRLLGTEWPRETLVNVNFPDLPPDAVKGIKVCRQGRRKAGTAVVEGHDPGGRPYVWIGSYESDATTQSDTDLAVISRGAISVTPLHLDLTHVPSLDPVREALS